MRRAKLATAMSLFTVLMLVVVIPGLAASTTKSLSTNFTLINLGSGSANGTVQYLETDGSPWGDGSESFTIPDPGGQAIFRQYYPAGSQGNPNLSDGSGSVVIESDQPLGAVVQIQARNQNPTSNGAYSGFPAGDSSFYIPLVARVLNTASGLGNSQIIVQNAGTSATDFAIDLVNPDGSAKYTKSVSGLQPGASYYYDLADESSSNVNDQWIGSAVARTTTGGGIIAVVSSFFTGDAMQTFNGFSTTSPAQQFFVPLFTSRLPNSLSSPITIQNLSGGTIAAGDVDVTCTPDPSMTGYTTLYMDNLTPILDTASYSWNPVVDMTIPTGFLGSCVIDSTADIVAFVQLRFIASGEAAAHEALPGGTSDTRAFIPLVAKRLPNGFATAVTIQNLSPVTVTMDLTYNPSGGGTAITINNVEVGPYASLIQNHRVDSGPQAVTQLADGWQGSLVVESDEPVGSFVQLTFARFINPYLPFGDNFMAHNAFTQP